VEFKTGDIYLTTSTKLGAKIVLFLMQSPTIYHQIWRWARGTLNTVTFYHAGMVLNEEQIIEQQATVRLNTTKRINSKNYIIWRSKNLTEQDRNKLVETSIADLGKGYGIWECIGKTISWLTGIKLSCNWIEVKDTAICVVRVAEWYLEATGINFGEADPDYITTAIMHSYCIAHPEEWALIDLRLTN